MPSLSTSACVLAIDAGGTFFKSALVTPADGIVAGSQHSVPVNSQGSARGILESYVSVFEAAFVSAKNVGLNITGIGVSTPGPFDYARHTSLMEHKFQSIRGLNLRGTFDSLYPPVRDMPVRFIHDVHAFVMGEFRNGAACDYNRVLGVTLGTGVGSGCIIDGQIRDNGAGGPLVSLYRKPCREGILEDYVSRRGIIALYRNQAGNAACDGIDVVEIAALARSGKNTAAIVAFEEMGAALGETLRPVIDELSVTCLVIGGQISKAFPLFGAAVSASLGACKTLKKVTPAKHPDTAAFHGIGALCFGSH
jgi:glucokinase